MNLIFSILGKNWKVLCWVAAIALSISLGYSAYKKTWRKIAFAHKEVKALVIKAKSDSLELETLYKSDDLQKARINDDSLNYYSKELEYQLLTKKLLNRAVYAERITKETRQENDSLKADGSCWEFYGFKNQKSRRLDCISKERI